VSITEFKDIAPLFAGIDYVYHLAALARVRPSVKTPLPYNEVNVTGTLNVLEACRLANVTQVIFSSSSSVFGDYPIPHAEEAPYDPLNPYAMQKAIAEQYITLYIKAVRLTYAILRFFNVYGPRQIVGGAYSTVIGVFIDQKRRGLPLTIFGDGEQRRDFTHIRDTVNACIQAMGSLGIYNVGRGNNKSVNEIANMISPLNQMRLPAFEGEARETLCANGKARLVLNWEPTIDVTPEIIEEMEQYDS
jgi:UDP-glucose 4-epimerase